MTLLFAPLAFMLEIVGVYANVIKGKVLDFYWQRFFFTPPTVIIDYMLYPDGRTELRGQ